MVCKTFPSYDLNSHFNCGVGFPVFKHFMSNDVPSLTVDAPLLKFRHSVKAGRSLKKVSIIGGF